MSTEIDTLDDAGSVTTVYRTVTPGYGSHSDDGMTAIGWTTLLGVLVILFPLLPFVAFVRGVRR